MIKSMLKDAVAMRAEDLLCALGLERRRRMIDHIVTATSYFIAGAVVGGCVALLLTPTTGRTLRGRLNDRLREAGMRAKRAAGDMRERAATGRDSYEEAAPGNAS